MRILFVSLTLLLASCGPAASVKIKAITGATLINGNGGAPIADAVVIVTDSTITAAGPRASTPIPSRAETIDATGQYLLPGLMDMHVHLGTRGGPGFDAKDYTSDRIVKNLNAYLYFGVTTVRSVGTERQPGFQVRAQQRAGEFFGARLFTAGRGFTAKRGHPSQEIGDIARQVDDPAAVRLELMELASQHVDLIKIWIDDLGGKAPKVKKEVIEAIVTGANKYGIPVVAHIHTLDETQHFFNSGGAGFLHMIRDTEDIPAAFITQLVTSRKVFTPTLVRQELGWFYAEHPELLNDPEAEKTLGKEIVSAVAAVAKDQKPSANARLEFDRAARNTRKLAQAGVLIAAGSDGGSSIDFPGLMTHRELELLAAAGFTPMEVITAATKNGAIALNESRELGTVEPGKRADLLLVAADPLKDIKNLRRISRVMANGAWVDREKLVTH